MKKLFCYFRQCFEVARYNSIAVLCWFYGNNGIEKHWSSGISKTVKIKFYCHLYAFMVQTEIVQNSNWTNWSFRLLNHSHKLVSFFLVEISWKTKELRFNNLSVIDSCKRQEWKDKCSTRDSNPNPIFVGLWLSHIHSIN